MTDASDPARWKRVAHALIALTWVLMVWGAATRAARAGIACPDWPLCHGQIIPPIDTAFYPANPDYRVYRVYLEFVHRVLAGLVAIGTGVVGTRLWRSGHRRLTIGLGILLLAQITMGAVTVLLRNAPFTVVIHLALALGFLAALLHARRRLPGAIVRTERPSTFLSLGYRHLLALLVAQLLVGGVVSSRAIGLACFDFPLCNGLPIPLVWTGPVAWQFAHRVLGLTLFLGAIVLTAAARITNASQRERRRALALATALCLQVMLGAINIWYQIPPPASAAHLGLAAVVFALVVDRILDRPSLGSTRAALSTDA